MTFEALTQKLGIEDHEPLPKGYYPVPDERKGELCTIEMIDNLQKKYGLFAEYYQAVREGFLDLENDPLRKTYLASISLFLKDLRASEVTTTIIKYPSSVNTPASNMLPLLAHLPGIDNTYETYRKMGLSHDETVACLKIYSIYIREEEHYRSGVVGISPAISNWMTRFTKCKIIYLGNAGLNFQPAPMADNAPFILKNRKSGKLVGVFGKNIPVHRSGIPLGSAGAEDAEGSFIAKFEETDEAYIGHTANERYISKEPITFSKEEWQLVLSPGDDMISVHIFWDADFTPEKISASLEEGVRRTIACYPEFNFKALHCNSWLMSPDVNEALGEKSKLSQFSSRFMRFPVKDAGIATLEYVFPNGYEKLEELEEKTTLQRAFKKKLLAGQHIYGTRGVIPLTELTFDKNED